jgi:DNA adenine methylase (dam)
MNVRHTTDMGKQKKPHGRPFVKWVGGKRQLLESIEAALPTEIVAYESLTYVEPFVGGGAVLFHLLSVLPNIEKAVINDINPDLINTYRAIRDNVDVLIAFLSDLQAEYYALDSDERRKSFYLAKRERYNSKALAQIENSALFIFLNRTCFNGLHRVNSRGLFNVPFGKHLKPMICDKETLRADSELLQDVEILNGDFEQTLPYATENSLFYFDPPYKPLSQTSSFNSYAKEEFDDREQTRLKRFCDRLNDKGYWWISSNSDVKSNDPDNNFFDNLYSSYQIDRVWASRSINANPEKRGKLTELLITNRSRKTIQTAINF